VDQGLIEPVGGARHCGAMSGHQGNLIGGAEGIVPVHAALLFRQVVPG
jgi:hypothetical protein